MSRRIRELEAQLEQGSSLATRHKIDLLHLLAWEYTSYFRDVHKLIHEARQLLDADGSDLQGEQVHQVILAQLDHMAGDFGRVLERLRPLIPMFQQWSNVEWLWRIRYGVVNAYQQLGEYALMWAEAEELVQLARKHEHGLSMMCGLAAMGIACARTRIFDRAHEYFQQCQAVAEANQEEYALFVVAYHRTAILAAQQQLEDALLTAHHATELAVPLGTFPQTHAYLNLSSVHVLLGDDDTALATVLTALHLSEDHDRVARMRINIHLGEIYTRMGRIDDALELLQLAREEAAQMETKEFLFRAHHGLAQVYKLRGNFELALHHFEQFHAVRAQVYNQDSDQRLKLLEVMHRTRQAYAEADQERRLREQDRAYFQQLSRMKDDFVASASHDLKNPLSSMRLVLHMLRRYVGADAPALDYIERLSVSADRMQALITDLLDLARLETGLALNCEMVPVLTFFRTAVEAHEMMAQDRQITLTFVCNLADRTILLDPVQMRRVIDNLLSNAIKYTPNGGSISVHVEQDTTALIVRVADSGPGIPTEAQPHLFERFYRVNRERQPEVEGTGLGLSIVKTIIEQHGGHIWVASEPNHGTTFSFTLPLERKL